MVNVQRTSAESTQKNEVTVSVKHLRELGLNVIPMDITAKRTPIVKGVKRLKWGPFNTYRATDRCVSAWQKMFPQHGWGIVTGPISQIFVLDVDGEEGKSTLKNAGVELPSTWVTKTQRGGLHYYFRWDDRLKDLPTSKYNLMNKVDIRGKGGYVVSYPWIAGQSPADVALAPIPDWLMKLVNKPKQEESVGNKAGWISELLNNLDEGKRHEAFAKIIGRFNRDGLAKEDIYTVLAPHADLCGLGKAELLIQVNKMVKLYSDQAAKPMSGMTARQLLSSAKLSIPWLVEGLFPKEGAGILAGHPKIGKSWLTLDLAITVSYGGLWLSKFQVVPGHVLYVDEESSQDMLGSRFLKLMNNKGLTDAKIQFHVKEGFNFSEQQKIDELRNIMNLLHPKLVIFDSLNRVHKAEENSASQMGEVFRRVGALSKEFGCFILFTDHLPHGQERFRGSSDKEAFVDAGFLAQKIGDRSLLIEHKYARHQTIPSFELALVDDGPEKTYVRWIG